MSAIGTSSGDIRMSYLNLLITQLQNQNPLEPMDNNQMAMQLAQLSQLEQMESMSNSFAKSLLVQQVDQAAGMIGKQVTYFVPGENEPRTGIVTQVVIIRGQPVLGVGNDAVDPADVIVIQDPSAPAPVMPPPDPLPPADDDEDDEDDVVTAVTGGSNNDDGSDESANELAAAMTTNTALAALQGGTAMWDSALDRAAAARTYALAAEPRVAAVSLADALQA